MLTRMSLNDFHRSISHDAAELANADPERHPDFYFRPRSQDAQGTVQGMEGLKLEWDPEGRLRTFPREEREAILLQMKAVAMRAVRQSLVDNQDLFVGVMLGEAREGRNYFDSFS